MGNYTVAQDLANQCLEITTVISDFADYTMMKALNTLIILELSRGHFMLSKQYALRALELSRNHHDQRKESVYLANLANVEELTGNYELAQEYYAQALEIDHQRNDYYGIIICLGNLGVLLPKALPKIVRA
jgi:tetratricopeptide (TPR) repeat protein